MINYPSVAEYVRRRSVKGKGSAVEGVSKNYRSTLKPSGLASVRSVKGKGPALKGASKTDRSTLNPRGLASVSSVKGKVPAAKGVKPSVPH